MTKVASWRSSPRCRAASTFGTALPAVARALPKPPPSGSSCSHPLTVDIKHLPPGAQRSVVLVGPDRYPLTGRSRAPPARSAYRATGLRRHRPPGAFSQRSRAALARWQLTPVPTVPNGARPGQPVGVRVAQALVPAWRSSISVTSTRHPSARPCPLPRGRGAAGEAVGRDTGHCRPMVAKWTVCGRSSVFTDAPVHSTGGSACKYWLLMKAAAGGPSRVGRGRRRRGAGRR